MSSDPWRLCPHRKTNEVGVRVAAVIFDMDGVIIDTEGPVQICCQRAAAEMGFMLDNEFYSAELVGRGWADCDAALVRRFGSGFSCAELRSRFDTFWAAHLDSHGIAVKPGFHELVAFLRSVRIPLAVATSTHNQDAHISLRAAGIRERFDAFVTGDEVARGKPHPEIYLTAASRLGIAPDVCVALEDSSAGALAAAGAGMTTLIIPDGGHMPSEEAARAAFRTLSSLHDARELLASWLHAEATRQRQ
jgi:beta-phosphoglucomutase-like phosphatase (HAD superfamily)